MVADMKRPSFQFYPSDWLRDTALRTCSVGARGLWIDMICYMHQGSPYGFLKVNQKVILSSNLATMCGATLDIVDGWLKELESAGVFSIDESGAIYSRRMIRDEEIRNSRALGGKLGGNPALINAHKVNHKVDDKVNQNPTPSSASSSASSSSTSTSKTIVAKRDCNRPETVSEQVWADFQTLRRAKKAPLTSSALSRIDKEAGKAGILLEAALIECCARGWAGFKADWMKGEPFSVGASTRKILERELEKEARFINPWDVKEIQ